MHKTAAIVALVSLTLVALAPSATAFHGTPYNVFGTACVQGTPVCFPASLQYGGGGIYRVSIGIAQLPTSVTLGTVIGREVFTRVWFGAADWCGFTEFTEYLGYDQATGGTDFRVTGTQDNCLGGIGAGGRQIHLTGHYRTWDLDVKL